MDDKILQKIAEQDAKLDAIFASTEKTRKYIFGMVLIAVVAFVLPLVGLAFAIPALLNTLSAVQSF